MAYTIISQNNTTTTLADENGNVITVPARVTLATSTDYTIIKVNNNSVDLEDGDGKIIRGVPACVVLAGEGGGGGGDSHNKGYYATQAALEEAYPTGEAGDYAVVGDTDTIWIWDEDGSAWVDSDTKGQVTSVNNQTGEVTIGANDILPSQTGNSGKFLTTDGTDASWSDKPLVNKSTGTNGLAIEATSDAGDSVVIGKNASSGSFASSLVAIGRNAKASSASVAIGMAAQAYSTSVVIGWNSTSTANYTISIGRYAHSTAIGAIQINSSGNSTTNSDANTFKVANANGNFEMMNANGNLPADRLASTTGLADGNYRLRLVMASGVPTLEWVAE